MSMSNLNSARGSDDQSSQDGDSQNGVFAIVLAFQSDGSIDVCCEDGDGSDDDSNNDDGDVQTVDSLRDAVELVNQLAQENGYQDDDDGDDESDDGGDDNDGDGDDGGNSDEDSGADADAGAAIGSSDQSLAPSAARALWNRLARRRDQARSQGR